MADFAAAQAQPVRVLWWNGMEGKTNARRQAMATYVDQYGGGQAFQVQYRRNQQGGALAQELAAGVYDIVILDIITRRRFLNGADTAALQQFYGSGKTGLMLDGSFWIRNTQKSRRTDFPGPNGELAGFLMNQMFILAEAGGGILFAADHDQWQTGANYALKAILPNAQFRGLTNPSTDGEFIGDALLAKRVPVTARNILRHWEAVPNQGEAPVGQYVDFLGRPVTLYSMVETADKPGGGRKRPYISSTVFPGEGKTAIDSDQPVIDNIPTHKSGG